MSNNPYYHPEKMGLEVVGGLDDPEASYSFDDLIVWRHIETGDVYYASDCGCSCPTPFEDYDSLEKLTKVTNETWKEFQEAVETHCHYGRLYNREDFIDKLAADRTQLLQKVSKLI